MLNDFILRLKDGRLIFNRRVILKDISHIKCRRIDSRTKNKTWIPKWPLGNQLSHFFAQAHFLLALYATDFVRGWPAWTLSHSRQMCFKNYLSRTYWTGLVFWVLINGRLIQRNPHKKITPLTRPFTVNGHQAKNFAKNRNFSLKIPEK